jgi:hypothetical protein
MSVENKHPNEMISNEDALKLETMRRGASMDDAANDKGKGLHPVIKIGFKDKNDADDDNDRTRRRRRNGERRFVLVDIFMTLK